MNLHDDILTALRDPSRFIRLTLSGRRKKDDVAWERLVVQPAPGGGAGVQVVFQGERKEETRSIFPEEIDAAVRDFLGMGFCHIDLQCADADLHVRISKKGRVLGGWGKPTTGELPAPTTHDRPKRYAFAANEPDAFLEAVGIMRKGRVLASMQNKFRQINRFIELLGHTRVIRESTDRPLRIVDCGCGRALLTLAVYHWLKHIEGHNISLSGVDANPDVIAAACKMRDRLGYDEVRFVPMRVIDFDLETPPSIVLSLHACDTATDEAIAQGVKWEAASICCVPCCQHELHRQLAREEFRAVLRHGILRERTADIVTDALRAAALRVMGYRAEVIEFISPEATSKNLMLRAEQTRGLRDRENADEYLRLRTFWGVTPHIETLLGETFGARLNRGAW